MSEKRIRVALVGCGRIAHVHAGYLRQTPHVDFIGACDLSSDAREAFTRRWQVPTFLDVEELMAAGQPDAVHVVTPPASHAPLAHELLAAGLHVMVEKPMALTTAEADRMVAAADAAGRVLTVDHNRWFDPVVMRARAMLDSGELGELAGVDVFQGAVLAEDGERGTEHWVAGLPGGSLYDSAPHPAYLMTGFAGAASDVRVIAEHRESGTISALRAVVECERALGTYTICSKTQPISNRIILSGSMATADINLNTMTLIVRRNHKVPKLVGKVLPNLAEATQLVRATVINGVEFVTGKQRFYPGMGVHFRLLYEALAKGEPPPVTPRAGRDAMDLLERVWNAGQKVTTPNASEAA